LKNHDQQAELQKIRAEVNTWMDEFPLY